MTENDMEEKMSFAELLESSSETPGHKLFPGDKISGKVLKVGKDTIFVDLGGKSEGIADIQEFLGKDGILTVKEGDWVEMRVASIRDGIHLTKGMKIQGADAIEILPGGKRKPYPCGGKGFELSTRGVLKSIFPASRAFCPLSQIDPPVLRKT